MYSDCMATNDVICPQCGFKWKYRPGLHGKYCFYYCNRCGKEKAVILGFTPGVVVDLAADYGVCRCGGVFTINCSHIICPKCGNEYFIEQSNYQNEK